MSRYGLVWLEIAREQYITLPDTARSHVDARVEELLEDPARQSDAAYDRRTDQWTATYGAGLVVYAVVPRRERLIILRLV
jgi:hypothetical protein